MLYYSFKFNQDIGGWNVSSGTNVVSKVVDNIISSVLESLKVTK